MNDDLEPSCNVFQPIHIRPILLAVLYVVAATTPKYDAPPKYMYAPYVPPESSAYYWFFSRPSNGVLSLHVFLFY